MNVLATERLTLRPLKTDDARHLAPLASDWDIARMASSIPFPLPPICIEGFILLMEARAERGSDHVFGLEYGDDGLIGVVGAHQRRNGVEIGYWLGRQYWGQGLATEAARFIAEYAADLDKGEVIARHFADNPASGRVLEKVGFVYTGDSDGFSLARRAKAPMRDMKLAS